MKNKWIHRTYINIPASSTMASRMVYGGFHSFSLFATALVHWFRFICVILITKDINKRIFFQHYSPINYLKVELPPVNKPLTHGREKWGWDNRSSGRDIALQSEGEERAGLTWWFVPNCYSSDVIALQGPDWLLTCICVHSNMTLLLFILPWGTQSHKAAIRKYLSMCSSCVCTWLFWVAGA